MEHYSKVTHKHVQAILPYLFAAGYQYYRQVGKVNHVLAIHVIELNGLE